MKNPLAAHPPWRQLAIVSIALTTVIVLASLAFAWPSARVAPRELPVGVTGSTAPSHAAAEILAKTERRGFDLHLYVDRASAERAIRHRQIYGAFDFAANQVTVLDASAASPSVAQLLTAVGGQLAAQLTHRPADVVDVVATSPTDPRGTVLTSALLPLTIASIVVAAATALLIGFRPAWRQLGALAVVSAVAGLGAYVVAQGFLGALPGEHLATWAALALTILAISATTAGLIAILGPAGLGISAVIMVFIGNPFAGVGSAPQLLPGAVDHLGQWLPPGAAASLLRSSAYFHGYGSAGHLLVLTGWALLGIAAVVVGHHTSPRFAAHPRHRAHAAVS